MKRVLVLAVVLSLLLIVAMTTAVFATDRSLSIALGMQSHEPFGYNGLGANAMYDSGSDALINAGSLTWGRACGGASLSGTAGHAFSLSEKWEGYIGLGVGWANEDPTVVVVEADARYLLSENSFLGLGWTERLGGCDRSTILASFGMKISL